MKIGRTLRFAVAIICLATYSQSAIAETLRIATYNIEHLKSNISSERASQIKAVLDSLQADVIELQEIADRAAASGMGPISTWCKVKSPKAYFSAQAISWTMVSPTAYRNVSKVTRLP